MSSDELTQAEADALLAMQKHRISEHRFPLPDLGRKLTVDLVSVDKRERFQLDMTSSHIKLSKFTFQNRARQTIILARLDIDGAPHRNPDDGEIPGTHLHLFREGYGDKWAFPVPSGAFKDLSSRWTALQDFMKYTNITEPPEFDRGLFS
ncbi:MAG: hypothetical protein WCD20_19920 [Rhodomicrobium sp.]